MSGLEIEEEQAEKELILRVQKGAKEEFQVLVQAYQGLVFSSIVRQGVDLENAKELTQEVMLKAYVNLQKFRFEARFSTWLVRIAINHTSNYYSSRMFRDGQSTESIGEANFEAIASSGDRFDKEALSKIQEAVAELPLSLREVLVLCCFENYSYEEVSKLLDIPIGTVRSRLHKARMQVKSLYFEE